MTDHRAMRRFFAGLIYINGAITVGLSLVILASLWFPAFFAGQDMMWKIVVSYGVVLMNFAIFMGMDRKIADAARRNETEGN